MPAAEMEIEAGKDRSKKNELLLSHSPGKGCYLFLALQLLVRISIQLSSLGIKSNPQAGCEGMRDEE